MKIIVHLGAHRSATTTMQHYLRGAEAHLRDQGVAIWEPRKLRKGGLFEGLYAGPNSAASKAAILEARVRIGKAFGALAREGISHVIISEENLLGSVKGNLRGASLYPDLLRRVSGFCAALGRPVDQVVIGLRAQEQYWPSALAYAVKRGADVPSSEKIEAIAASQRGWKAVIEELRAGFDGAEILAHRFEDFADAPDARLAALLEAGFDLPRYAPRLAHNAAPDLAGLRAALAARGAPDQLPAGQGAWQPFGKAARARLREAYLDDLFWLASQGSRGIRLIEKEMPEEAGSTLPLAAKRGLRHDEARRMGRAG